ncbi:MAG TPA: Hpt domain-containing protein [Burkholderiales bacterium]|nr:Hpt domain-containing protein [Burkholderiales bacterium]
MNYALMARAWFQISIAGPAWRVHGGEEMTTLLLDRDLIAEIKRVGHATGRHDLHGGFVRKLEETLADFPAAFSRHLAQGDTAAAVRSAHTLKGSCRQIGAHALGDLFADIERSAKAGDYAAAKRMFENADDLIAQSIDALKQA